ncbi:MAG: hypothetical protein HY064_07270 [Bacteroidetes bacterium]|nr:hypothetical protein [Bacteroidota bacterium]
MKQKLFFFLILFFVMSIASHAQCAMCRAVAQSGQNTVSGGLNNAILYLMALPYLLIIILFRKRIWTFLKELRGLWVKN